MTRRYVSPDQISIEQEFDLVRSPWEFPANFNAAPSQAIPVIRVIEDQPDPALLTWGFGEHDTANLPVETLNLGSAERGRFARAQRCLLPALGFYEWRVAANGAPKPYFIHVEDQEMFAFAGLWEREACTLITLPGNVILAGINGAEPRMPAILARDMREIWLYGSVSSAAAALIPYPSERLVTYAVSSRVDSLDANDETLIEPLESSG